MGPVGYETNLRVSRSTQYIISSGVGGTHNASIMSSIINGMNLEKRKFLTTQN